MEGKISVALLTEKELIYLVNKVLYKTNQIENWSKGTHRHFPEKKLQRDINI